MPALRPSSEFRGVYDAMSDNTHWQRVYSDRPVAELGWYAPSLQTSTEWIADLKLAPDEPIIDVGGGASTLVDDLLNTGHRAISVLDLSERALSLARERLGDRAALVTWLPVDVLAVELSAQSLALWHDRAAFHFLLDAEQQRSYRRKLLQSLKVGGRVILATFGLDAPPRCSGLPVQCYSVELLEKVMGQEFELQREQREIHHTPSGLEQAYLYCQFQRRF